MIQVVENCLTNPARVRREALSSEFFDWPAPDGEIYKRVCVKDVPGLQDAIEKECGPVEMLGMGYRLNYSGERPNASIHSDLGWGTHAAVLYLCDGPGGTAFWRHKATNAERIDVGNAALLEQVKDDWEHDERWEQTQLIALKFNRCVIYDSALFHSRWPFEAFGNDPKTGRLVAVAFFNMREK